MKLEDYIEKHSSPEDETLYNINRETHLDVLRPIMLSGHIQGKFLEMISSMIRPKRILEIGTYTAYSTICLARGLAEDGKIISIEKNKELEKIIKKNIEKASLVEKVEIIIGDAKDIIPGFSDNFDIVFIDADKQNNKFYYESILPLTRKGGFILIDNCLWHGKVLDENHLKEDKDTQSIDAFNDYIQKDNRVENLLLSIRDGIMLMRKR
jgi:caffeoyl-CoA O-methyltransferase